ncbi:DedA family protein [Gracilibacillus kekensis]|uniref:Membrane protein DedA, SNARE-associated domain n=1 Tax=Gracilibacillus kekensis TaxID=1027249 RepID=A0A1M7J436_9BACI|nr:DedA family protein [Gracilibacillus kekensis]SHM47651.1 membrane protein DedA, SNARE-associated domain [Gracilibacillus kekensis]
MEQWLIQIMNDYGYIGIMFLIAIENIFPPIPSEIILTFGGFLTTTSSLHIVGVISASTAGSVLGAIILYSIGLQMDVARLEKIIGKWGHILRVKREDIYKADKWFDKHGYWTIFFCRFVPLIRSLISIPAGMSHMNIGLFLLFTTLGTLIWNTVLVFVGATLGASWENILHYLEVYSTVIYLLLSVLVIIILLKLVRRK